MPVSQAGRAVGRTRPHPLSARGQRSAAARRAFRSSSNASGVSGRAKRKRCPRSQCSRWRLCRLALSWMPSARVSMRRGLSEQHDGLDQRRCLLRAGDLADEGAVDLQRISGEAAKVSQRAVAGAEPVDRDPHAEPLQSAQALGAAVSVAHDRDLGHLERQEPRIQARRPQCVATSAASSPESSREEMLTATPSSWPSQRQSAACRHASASTQRPIGRIRPLRSAIGRTHPAGACRGSGAPEQIERPLDARRILRFRGAGAAGATVPAPRGHGPGRSPGCRLGAGYRGGFLCQRQRCSATGQGRRR